MISIIVPAYNEQDSIQEVVQRIQNTLNQSEYKTHEIIVVDDGSQDETAKRAKETGARIIPHLNNLGYGKAIKTGIQAATYDTIAILDSDGTYPAEKLPDLINEYQKGYDLVVGARRGRYLDSSLLKAILRFVLKRIVEFTSGRKIPDINSGLRVFSKKTVTPFFPQLSNAFSFTTSQTLAYMLTFKTTLFTPVDYKKRVGSTKVRLGRDILRTLQYITEVILYFNPFKLFLIFSLSLLMGALFFFGMAALPCNPWFAVHYGTTLPLVVGLVFLSLAILVLNVGFLSIILSRTRAPTR